ncbi:MAG: hypothetical protein PHW13_11835 [Methylococcales bacterium]|nr:hypothetical protein [Methylococcales bacterium]
MNTADFLKNLLKPFNSTLILVCLLISQAVAANSAPRASAPVPVAMHALDLSLPDNTGVKPVGADNGSQHQARRAEKSDNVLQIIAGSKKQEPLNMDCGMNVMQTSNPDVALTSRLTGECDFKYHY